MEGKENGDRPPTVFGLKVALGQTIPGTNNIGDAALQRGIIWPTLEVRVHTLTMHCCVGTGGSGGSMNRGPEFLGPPSSGATEKF